jgi:hypothetical protein
MDALRKTGVFNESNENLLINPVNKKRRCGLGMVKCFGFIIFLVGLNSLSFYMGMKYSKHLEDNSESH